MAAAKQASLEIQAEGVPHVDLWLKFHKFVWSYSVCSSVRSRNVLP